MTRTLAASLAIIGAVSGLPACSHPDLTDAVNLGDDVFEQVAASAPNLDAPGRYGQPPLLRAAERGDVAIVRYLLSHGAQPNARDAKGMTALHLAVRSGQLGSVLALLDSGADVNAPGGSDALRPLHLAISEAGSEGEMVRLLLRHGANPNVSDSAWNQSPLHWLAAGSWSRAATIAAELINAGADLTSRDIRGFTPLHVAALSNNAPIVREYIARHQVLDTLTPMGRSALDVAIEYRNDDVAQILAEAGATTHELGGRLPPLEEAARMDDVERETVLLASGADPRASYQGRTPLSVAQEYGSSRVADLLARHMAGP